MFMRKVNMAEDKKLFYHLTMMDIEREILTVNTVSIPISVMIGILGYAAGIADSWVLVLLVMSAFIFIIGLVVSKRLNTLAVRKHALEMALEMHRANGKEHQPINFSNIGNTDKIVYLDIGCGILLRAIGIVILVFILVFFTKKFSDMVYSYFNEICPYIHYVAYSCDILVVLWLSVSLGRYGCLRYYEYKMKKFMESTKRTASTNDTDNDE